MTTVDETVTGAQLREFMRSWATGVAIVTGSLRAQPTGCTVNSFLSVSLDQPLVLISLAGPSRTLAAIMSSQAFGVNLLGTRQRHLATVFATAGTGDRFTGVPHRMRCGVPVITGALAAAVFAVRETIAVADHVLVLGSPLWIDRAGGTDPTVFFGGRYQSLSG